MNKINRIYYLKFIIISIIIVFALSCREYRSEENTSKNEEVEVRTFKDYITIDEYNMLHSEQEQFQEDFLKIVQGKPEKLIRGIQDKPIKIAFIYPGEQVSDYWRRSVKSFKARMDEIGIVYQLDEIFTRAGNLGLEKQEEQIKSALDKNVDYLVFTMNVMQHKQLIERILTDGYPKLILQNITTPIWDWEGKQPFIYVGFDHIQGTEILARYFIEKTGGTGNYAVLYFSEGYVSDMRGKTFINYVKENSDLKLISAFFTDGQRDRARTSVLSILEKEKELEFIYACSTDVALGAIDALKETGNLGNIAINGWGGGSSELSAILNGDMDITVMRNNDDNGVAMAEAIRLDIEGKTEQIPVIFSGGFEPVEKGINPGQLNELMVKAFRYSGIE